MNTDSTTATLFFLDKTVLDKALPDTHKAALATLLKHENKMYPGALTKAIREETDQDVSVPATVKILQSLMDKGLVKKASIKGIITPSNISGYYTLTKKGSFLATVWAKENGVSEAKIQDTIKRCLIEYKYPEHIIDNVIRLREQIIDFKCKGISENISINNY